MAVENGFKCIAPDRSLEPECARTLASPDPRFRALLGRVVVVVREIVGSTTGRTNRCDGMHGLDLHAVARRDLGLIGAFRPACGSLDPGFRFKGFAQLARVLVRPLSGRFGS